MKTNHWRCLGLISVVVFIISSAAVLADGGKISAVYFGDYYYIAAHHNEELESRNGFWTRRVYLTYDRKLNETFSSRVRFEVNSPDGLKEGASGKNVPYVKDAYLKISPKGSSHSILLGRSITPTFSVVPKVWGYRAVEKSMLLMQKYGSTRDLGIAVKGKVPGVDMLSYHAMVGNGAGTGAETNKYKRGYLSATLKPAKGVIVQGYVDLEPPGIWHESHDPNGICGISTWRTIGRGCSSATRFEVKEKVRRMCRFKACPSLGQARCQARRDLGVWALRQDVERKPQTRRKSRIRR